jgi:LuxR family maltose regulon positive regulatory protein
MQVETVTHGEVTSDGDPLLRSKLRAAEIRSRLVVRQRLFDLLDAGTDGPLTVLSGPPGAGRTALVSSWIDAGAAPGRVTWLGLEAGDDRPEVFWTYVLAGLARDDAELAAVRRSVPPGSVDGAFLARLCECLAARPDPSVLVLDDVEVLGQGQVVEGIDFLIRHAGPRLRLVTIGRGAPALPLHRYRLAGWVTEIGPDELAFTPSEADVLLAEHGVALPPGAVRLLVERTEGWAAGLRLAALSLCGRSAADAERVVRGFRGARPDVAEYFAAEVLAAQPAGIREFLLTTSVPDEVTPGLADELSGRTDGAQILSALVHDHAFVTESDGRYRYHPLFRDALRAGARHDLADRVVGLHRVVTRRLLADGDPVTAALHATAAGDWEQASSLVVDHLAVGRLLVGDDSARLTEAFAAMPAETDGAAPSVVRAAMAVAAHRERIGANHLSRADALDTTGWLPVRLAVAALRAVVAASCLDVERTVSAASTVAVLSTKLAGAGRPVPPDLQAVVLTAKAVMLLWSGRLTAADDSLTAALRAAETAGLRRLTVRVLGEIALLNAIRGQLRQATWSARTATRLADQLGLTEHDRPAVIDAAFAWIHTERCDVAAARRHVRSVSAWDDPLAVAVLTAVRGRSHATGDTAAAPADVPRPPWLLTSGNAVDPTAWSGPTLTTRVDSWLRTAAEQLDLGRSELASRSLDRALTLAAPENLRRPIVQAPPRLRHFIRHNPDLARRHGWLEPARTGTSDDRPPVRTPVEPLTNREREVLRHMAALLSTEEIGRAMFVSVNTVKTHIRGVLRKLSVGRRNDAIRRARELGML